MSQYKDKEREAMEFLGKYRRYIKEIIFSDIKRSAYGTMMAISTKLGHTEVQGGRVVALSADEHLLNRASTRFTHYVNTAMVASRITTGLFEEVGKASDLSHGVALCGMLHDHQPPFGHNGEEGQNFASQQFLGGKRFHGVISAMNILYRMKPLLIEGFKNGIRREIIVYEYSKMINRRLPQMVEDKSWDAKRIINALTNEKPLPTEIDNDFKVFVSEINEGLHPIISEKIKREVTQKKDTMEDAVFALATAAAFHNGERKSHAILPRERSHDEIVKELNKTLEVGETDRNMHPSNIFDAIVLISDQISSVPFDIIDGLKAGMVESIPEDYIPLIVDILCLDEIRNSAKGRLGDDTQLEERNKIPQELKDKVENKVRQAMYGGNARTGVNIDGLNRIANRVQTAFINDIIGNSNSDKIEMSSDFRELFQQLRLTTSRNYQRRTYTAQTQKIVFNAYIRLTEQLVSRSLDENKEFSPELNNLFRRHRNEDTKREEEVVVDKFLADDSSDILERFYRYLCGLRLEEYETKRREVREVFSEHFGRMIKNAIESASGNASSITLIGSDEYYIQEWVENNMDALKLIEENRRK